MTVHPFEIQISEEALDDLRERLARTRWTDEVSGAGWDYGTSLDYLRELAAYWQDGYDWRTQEAGLNRFHQIRAEIDGFGVHAIHERGRSGTPLPLMLTHGWPGSFYQMVKLIPLLTDPAAHGGDPGDAFDIVVPSLPGFGFSDRPQRRGWTTEHTADLWARLMTEELGYEKFGAHGGDWGSAVTESLARRHADILTGIHLTDVPYGHIFRVQDPTEEEREYIDTGRVWFEAEGAYGAIQSTKPQTLAYGLNDSPVGLAAWIVEKFRTWSDCDGDIERAFTKDELLTNVMIYWLTETINSSMRGYYESGHQGCNDDSRIEVPTGFALFPKDLVPPPRHFAERIFNVQRWTEMPRGGHFATMEEPELLAEDIRAFYRQFR